MKRLTNIVNRAIEEVVRNKREPEEFEIDDIKESPKLDIKNSSEEKMPAKKELSDDDLIDKCGTALQSESPDSRRLLNLMLKRELVTDEEYDNIRSKYNI